MHCAEFISQEPTDSVSHFYRVLRRYLTSSNLVSVRASVAYVTWGGLSLIADELEAYLQSGNNLETLFGVMNNVTTPDALLYSVYLQQKFKSYKLARAFQSEYIDSEFHPKYFEFEYPDHSVRIIGSCNLTRGGLASNHETAIILSTPAASSFDRDFR